MPHSFSCPMCATKGFTLDGVRHHLKSEHKNTEMQVVCPVCAVTTAGNPNIMTRALEVHLALVHVRDLDILDGQSASRHLQKIPPTSLRSTMGSSDRERLLQRHLPTAVSTLPLSPTDKNSITLSGLLSQRPSSMIPGLAAGTSPSITVRNSAGPTSTMSSGRTADARQTSIAANSNKLKVPSGGSPVTVSPGATEATTLGPIEATTVQTTLEPVPDATASIHPYPTPLSTD